MDFPHGFMQMSPRTRQMGPLIKDSRLWAISNLDLVRFVIKESWILLCRVNHQKLRGMSVDSSCQMSAFSYTNNNALWRGIERNELKAAKRLKPQAEAYA